MARTFGQVVEKSEVLSIHGEFGIDLGDIQTGSHRKTEQMREH
jgi:hypothetical protein